MHLTEDEQRVDEKEVENDDRDPDKKSRGVRKDLRYLNVHTIDGFTMLNGMRIPQDLHPLDIG